MSSISSINSADQILQQQIQQDQIQQSSSSQDNTAAAVAMMQNMTQLLDSILNTGTDGTTPPSQLTNQVNNS
ncbi:MAG: hypothetical protein JSR39_02140 [Verrucomicrobia bacterium]|nr:hypothetical protein [Verrucomicrobiota bacterium]